MATENIIITKADGKKEPFDIVKLEASLKRAHATPAITQKVVDGIVKEIEDGMTTHDIYSRAFSLLKKFEKPIALRYSLRRAVAELGPSGFPFEQFVAEVFKSQGYETVTDQIVHGGCVEHEVDVVAWRGDELVMSEVKFHHELGLKSDLKVALYIKARFDDLRKGEFNYGGKIRKMSEGRLITNTKFTITAIKYAQCENLKIVGWNYPTKGNLSEMIDTAGLHPITLLSTLSDHDKKALLDKKIVLCKTILQSPSLLEEIGLTGANTEAVLEEIQALEATN